MKKQITMNHLDYLCDQINDALGTPRAYYDSEMRKANIGNRHIESSHSGYSLAVTVNEGGGISNVFGSKTKRELEGKLSAYLIGLSHKKQHELTEGFKEKMKADGWIK